jgi:hypothetical protein
MIALVSLALIASASAGQIAARPSHHKGQFLVKAVTFKHRLRACNAYPYAAPLDVYKNRNEKLTSDAPLPYKSCREFSFPLKAGDKLKFKVGDANAGVFSVSDLPNTDAVLLLVIHRHDTLTNAVSFESHVFAKLLNSQIAVIDTYKGSEKAAIRIEDQRGEKKDHRGEDLHYNTVVAVNPGDYDVVLKGMDGKVKSKDKLVAVNKESYVILRVGVEAQQGQSYPQEVIVAPKSEEPKWSGAYSPAPLSLLAALFFMCIH